MIEPIYLAAVGVMSAIAFGLYAWDKHRARHRAARVPENRLLLAELLGGWPGGFAARMLLRHKTRKPRFLVRSWAIVIVHLALIVWWKWGR